MSMLDIFWIFFIITALQPILKQKMLESSRLKMIHKIESQRKSRTILLVHRQETMSIIGFPVFRYIDINDSEEVIRAIRMTDEEIPIDLILHTPGGLVLASLQIANAIRQHKGKVTVFIPHYAMSGGTLIALASDEIVMDRHAVLGPVDPQLGEYPAASILKAVSEKDKNEIDDRTLILADMAGKAVRQVKEYVISLLKDKFDLNKATEIADLLTAGHWTHDYPLTCEAAINIGLPINCNMPREVYQLMNLFPQPVRRQPSVEYIPEPYRYKKYPLK